MDTNGHEIGNCSGTMMLEAQYVGHGGNGWSRRGARRLKELKIMDASISEDDDAF